MLAIKLAATPNDFKGDVIVKIFFIIALIFCVSACASPGVFEIGENRYTVTSGTSGGFSSASERAEVYKLASAHCAELGDKMEQITMEAKDGVVGRNAPSATLVFKCV